MKNTKLLKPAVALVLVAAMAVGGSLAYITSTTNTFENKFVYAYGDTADSQLLAIDLEETFTLNGKSVADMENKTAKFVPGDAIVKNPTVEVTKNSLEGGAYVFVKLTGDVEDVLALGLAVDTDTWTAVKDVENVYYLTAASTMVATPVFSDTTIDIAKDFNTAGTSSFDSLQTLTVDSYAIQTSNLATPEAAWAALNPTT